MEPFEVCIVGSGPAGVATAAALVKYRPELREKILILEKAQHPRHKLCGGGLTPWVDELLNELELEAKVRDYRVERVKFYLDDRPLLFDIPNLMRTVRRNEFDAALVASLRSKGLRILENTVVQEIVEEKDGLRLLTSEGEHFAKILVGADGAKSMVRRRCFHDSPSRVSRLLEVLVPADNGAENEFHNGTVLIDFRPMRQGLQGYIWDFPCYVGDQPHFNVGLFDSRIHGDKAERANLPDLLEQHLRERGCTPSTELMGHPERWFHPADCFSRPRVLLVGDAAGIEPWLGEGISAALAYGPIAAEAILHAIDSGDYSFEDYQDRILSHRLGKFLRRNHLVASLFYERRLQSVLPLFGRVLRGYMWWKHRRTLAGKK